MDPLSIIGLASSVLKATGLDSKIGKWMGGKSGAKSAEKVVQLAAQVVGEVEPNALGEKLKQHPELAVKLRETLLQHEEEILRIYMADVASAREMHVKAMDSDDRFTARFPLYFASFWSIVGAAFIFGVTFFPIQEGSQRVVDTILGFILATLIGQIVQFFFGSSSGSKEKTKALSQRIIDSVKKD